MIPVVLGLGSNKPYNNISPLELLACGCRELGHILKDMYCSSVYKTGAMYVVDQDDFYNMVVMGLYDGSPDSLLDAVHIVENKFGRNRQIEIRNGPRPLDIDIELFGNQTVSTANLEIPHGKICERAFVLKPFLELLEKNADENISIMFSENYYRSKIESLSDQKIDLFMKSDEFMAMLR